MKTLLKEFKAFINRGNVIDMAVGIIIGVSFGKIVDILVSHIIMPPIGMILGGVDFSELKITLKKASETKSAITVDYCLFINTLIDFVIVAITVFILIKIVTSLQKKKEATPTTQCCPECQMVIPQNAKRCGHCTSSLKK